MTRGLGLNRRKVLRGNRRSFFVESFRGWQKTAINTPHGTAEGIAPVIISASRATDIPAFYADWFMHRVRIGYLKLKLYEAVPILRKYYKDPSDAKYVVIRMKPERIRFLDGTGKGYEDIELPE